MKQVICIAGPTASGKSSWALKLAKKVDGEIINADSMQVYSDLQVLTARPSNAEMNSIPHHLYGHIDGRERYSVGRWTRDVVPIIFDCMSRDKTPILVGGTGLYFEALTRGLADIPQPDDAAMLYAKALLSQGVDLLRDEAERLDPQSASRVLGDDPQRLLRIVSVAKGTDRVLSEWIADTRPFIPRNSWKGAILLPERSHVYDRINARFDTMFEMGALEEVEQLINRGLDPGLPIMKAIGVKLLGQYLKDDISREEAISISKRDTRRFAKRQYTWFRGHAAAWVTLDKMPDDLEFEGV